MSELEGWTHYYFDDGSLDETPGRAPDVKPLAPEQPQVIHAVYVCPACEFSSMKKRESIQPDGTLIEIYECRGCGYVGWE